MLKGGRGGGGERPSWGRHRETEVGFVGCLASRLVADWPAGCSVHKMGSSDVCIEPLKSAGMDGWTDTDITMVIDNIAVRRASCHDRVCLIRLSMRCPPLPA